MFSKNDLFKVPLANPMTENISIKKPKSPLKYISHKSPQNIPVIIPISSPYSNPYENVIINKKFGDDEKNGINGKIDVCTKNAKKIIIT